ncbi:MAG TPA: hypothetical protein VF406_09920 [Thermodesulfobacteriota bacterium]
MSSLKSQKSAATIELLTPVARFRDEVPSQAVLPATLDGAVIGILGNNKPNSAVLFAALVETLGREFRFDEPIVRTKESPPIPAPEAYLDELAAKCSVVFTGTGD